MVCGWTRNLCQERRGCWCSVMSHCDSIEETHSLTFGVDLSPQCNLLLANFHLWDIHDW